MTDWYVYIARCADGTLYTGITTDVHRRLVEHNSGRGSKYTAVRRPVAVVYVAPAADRSAASRLERRIKLLPREEKLSLIAGIREAP
jgi:putative endonuclease